jgi:hypothetical protein
MSPAWSTPHHSQRGRRVMRPRGSRGAWRVGLFVVRLPSRGGARDPSRRHAAGAALVTSGYAATHAAPLPRRRPAGQPSPLRSTAGTRARGGADAGDLRGVTAYPLDLGFCPLGCLGGEGVAARRRRPVGGRRVQPGQGRPGRRRGRRAARRRGPGRGPGAFARSSTRTRAPRSPTPLPHAASATTRAGPPVITHAPRGRAAAAGGGAAHAFHTISTRSAHDRHTVAW